MSTPQSPLAAPMPWNLVANDYTRETVPQFEPFAMAAMRIAGPLERTRVLDVACGPGTLSLLAAKVAARVDAADFSPAMIDALRARVAVDGVTNVTPHEADCQTLPFEDHTFDAAFSMFGLIFFPDRARGLAEMRRVLKKGAPAVISSWKPFDEVPFMQRLFGLMAAELPNMPFGKSKAPLGTHEEFEAELSAAGFGDVKVEPSDHAIEAASMDELWGSMLRTLAPLVLLSKKLPPDVWTPFVTNVRNGLIAEFGAGPQTIALRAWLGSGRA